MASFVKPKITYNTARAALPVLLLALALAALAGTAFADDNTKIPAATQQPAAPPAPAAAAPAVSPQSPPPYKPGFLHQLKVWWDDSIAAFGNKGGKAADPTKTSDASSQGAADAAKSVAKDAPKDTPKDAPADEAKDAPKNAVAATQDAMKNAVEATKGVAATATDAMKNAVEATKNAATAIVRLPNTRVVDVHETCGKAPNGASDCAAAAMAGCRGKGFNGGKPLDVRTAEKCDTRRAQAGQLPGVQCAAETVVIRALCQ